MKTKGFTLVELLAVIAILGVLLAVSVPVYIGISDAINQRLQETKLAELKAKSAEYSEEIGKNVFDVKSLIESGKLSPDSELDDYKDPMTGRDMSCDVITVTYEGASYEATITESDECYEEQYLENLYGMIEFYLVDENEREITRVNENTWLRNQRVYVRYRLKEEYQGVGEIKEANWTGLQPVHCNTSDINSDQCQKYLVETYENGVRNVRVQLNVKLLLRKYYLICNDQL